ncbi:MAG: GlsB/YeaQ/YmgE family stress response membrane protein [Actinomycetota bacterium]|nr:GlsB/YeaQ/YmgE family stress response membrane protein [Actinomycetota bacterium]
MSILYWILTGLIAGLLGRWIVKDERTGCLYTLAVGVLGALIGGALMHAAGGEGINEFSLRTVLVAALGAILLLLVLQAIGGRRSARSRFIRR